MTVETFTLLAYCVAIIAASLLGGWLPSLVRMTHTRTQLVMSFVSGLMLGVAVYHLLPHGLLELQNSPGSSGIDTLVGWTMVGMVVMLLLLRLFHFHQHDFGDHGHDHNHRDHCDDALHDVSGPHPLSWVGIALGLGLHTLTDGVALGAAVSGGDAASTGFSWIGMGVFLHKPLDALSITSMMQAGGWGGRSRGLANLAFATLCPLGALLFVWGVGLLDDQAYAVGAALAFAAGAFLCISLGDLLPEVHFHSHDRVKLTLMFLVGIALAWGLRFVEPAADHGIVHLPAGLGT